MESVRSIFEVRGLLRTVDCSSHIPALVHPYNTGPLPPDNARATSGSFVESERGRDPPPSAASTPVKVKPAKADRTTRPTFSGTARDPERVDCAVAVG